MISNLRRPSYKIYQMSGAWSSHHHAGRCALRSLLAGHSKVQLIILAAGVCSCIHTQWSDGAFATACSELRSTGDIVVDAVANKITKLGFLQFLRFLADWNTLVGHRAASLRRATDGIAGTTPC